VSKKKVFRMSCVIMVALSSFARRIAVVVLPEPGAPDIWIRNCVGRAIVEFVLWGLKRFLWW